jgi:hypothetical protein
LLSGAGQKWFPDEKGIETIALMFALLHPIFKRQK